MEVEEGDIQRAEEPVGQLTDWCVFSALLT